MDFFYFRQIRAPKLSRSNIMNDAPRAQRRFFRRPRRHIVDEPVNGHLQAPGGRGCCQHFIILQRFDALLFTKIRDGSLQADPHITLQHGSWRLSLGPENRMFGVNIFKRVYNGGCRADFGYQHINFHFCLSYRQGLPCLIPSFIFEFVLPLLQQPISDLRFYHP